MPQEHAVENRVDGSLVEMMTRERLIQMRAQMVSLKQKFENAWQQTVGKIELINELLEEGTASQPPAD